MIGKRKRKLGKKGSLQDVMFIIGIIVFFGVIVLLGYRISSAYDTQIQGMAIVPEDAKAASTTLKGHYTGIVDNMFLVLTIGLCIVTLILAAMVRVHPVFIPIFFIVLLITIFVAGIASDIYQSIAGAAALTEYADDLIFITTILENLPLFIGFFGFLLMGLMYKLYSAGE